MTYTQVDEEKKVEAVKDFYNNLGAFSIVDKLQLVSKYHILVSKLSSNPSHCQQTAASR